MEIRVLPLMDPGISGLSECKINFTVSLPVFIYCLIEYSYINGREMCMDFQKYVDGFVL